MRQLRQIFSDQRDAFKHFFDAIDLGDAHMMSQELTSCTGSIHFTGVGKSGLVARKLAKTFCATGTRALYLDPIDALHGDFGLVHTSDLVVILSKSAKSQELLPLIGLLKKQKIEFVVWCSCSEGGFQGALLTQILPLKSEVCPFKKAPLTSSALQLVFGNCMAASVMQKKGFDLDRYSINHSGGSIGKDLLKVKDVMVQGDDLPLAFSHETLEKKLIVLSQKRLGTLLIVDESLELIGIFTDGDLRRAIQEHGSQFICKPLEELMTKTPKIVGPEVYVDQALSLMHLKEKQVMVLPVVQEKKVIGLVHLHQIS